MSPGQSGFVPGTKWVCPRDKPRFSPYFTQWKPSLSLGQTRFVPGTSRGRRAAERVCVLKVYVPFSLAKIGRLQAENYLPGINSGYPCRGPAVASQHVCCNEAGVDRRVPFSNSRVS